MGEEGRRREGNTEMGDGETGREKLGDYCGSDIWNTHIGVISHTQSGVSLP